MSLQTDLQHGALAPPTDPEASTAEHDDLLRARAGLAVHGIATTTPVRRGEGAGPSDDGHVMIDGRNAALPNNPASPYTVAGNRVLLDGNHTGLNLEVVRRPAFYRLSTADGVSYEQIARLHGRDVLATTVVQTCIRYDTATRCRFCTIEESLRSGSTVAAKTPSQLAEVAEAAVRLDGITQMVMTTGTTTGPDRGARNLIRCVRAVRAAVPTLPIQIQIEPPEPLSLLNDLHAAGATAVGIHVESMDQDIRERWTPGKAAVPISQYLAAWDRSVEVFGFNRVSTYLLIGLGETNEELLAAATSLIARGVYPFVVPLRTTADSLATRMGAVPPSPERVEQISRDVAQLLAEAGMTGADQQAGCAACGACSALSAAGG